MSGINDLFSIAQSGLNAAGAIVNTAASNIANADTNGYKTRRVNLVASPGNGGVDIASISSDPTFGGLDDQGNELSNVNLADEAISLRQGAILYSANAAVLRVGDRLAGTLLDLFDTHHQHGA